MSNVINLVTPYEPINSNNRRLTVIMTEDQYNHLLYCSDYVEQIREKARQKYYDKKEREKQECKVKSPKKKVLIPGTQTYQKLQNQQGSDASVRSEISVGGYRPLQLVVKNPY